MSSSHPNPENERLRRQLAETARELEMLTYSISHDLRAPLRVIRGFSEALKEDYAGQLDAEGQNYLGIMVENCEKMMKQMDGILTLSRLGQQTLSFSEVSSAEIIQALVTDAQTRHGGKRQINFRLGILPAVNGDMTMLKLVWTHLLDNAVKFTGYQATAEIEVGATVKDGEVVFHVRDNGAGFDMKYADKLFALFQRFHPEKEFVGLGVGLALCQRIVRRHGGRIWAEAKVGEGATLFFALPKDAK